MPFLSFLAGCVAIPIPLGEGFVSKGQEITAPAIQSVEPSVTTRQDVISRLGEPNLEWEDARIIVYDWDRVRWLLFWAVGAGHGTGAAGMAAIPTHHVLLIQFGSDGLVRRAEHVIRPTDVTYGDFLRAWALRP